MKKSFKYIIICIILIAITSGVTYIFINNKDKEEKKTNEKISFNNQELKEYLNYVPDSEEYASAYINNYKPLGYVLNEIFLNNRDKITSAENGTNAVSKDIVKEFLLNKYNENLDDYNLISSNENYVARCSGSGFLYNNDLFTEQKGGPNLYNRISVLDSYTTKNDDLIIYEYAAMLYDSPDYNKVYLVDYYQNKDLLETETSLNDNYKVKKIVAQDNDEPTLSTATKYLKEHKKEFTKYKHIFKKNSKGYYYYSTEVAK